VTDRLCVDTAWIAKETADDIEIVNRVDRDLDARQSLQKGEQIPWSVDREMNLYIDEPSEKASDRARL